MNLLPTKSPLEQDLQSLDESIIRSADALNHAAAVLKNEHARFWSLPTERLLAVLNADVERTLAIFAANTATGQALNAQLDGLGLPQYPARVPDGIGAEGIAFDSEAGLFTYTEPAANPLNQ